MHTPEKAEPVSVFEKINELQKAAVPFSVATIINVRGSASAKPGSKAVFDHDGRNLLGWVGGGCAEAFIGREGIEAIRERQPRTVVADLDDEIFGLGMPCGGVMDVLIEPVLPPQILEMDDLGQWHNEAEFYLRQIGISLRKATKPDSHISSSKPSITTRAELYLHLAKSIAKFRGKSGVGLRLAEDSGISLQTAPVSIDELLILGNSRITEELAALGVRLGWTTRVFGPPNLSLDNYPLTQIGTTLQVERFEKSFDELSVRPNSIVIVASHHKGDVEFILKALEAKSPYVGLVASRHRGEIVLSRIHESLQSSESINSVFVPTGLDIGANGPAEIGLSIFAELIELGFHVQGRKE